MQRDLESERESGVGRESEPEDGEVMRRREGGREREQEIEVGNPGSLFPIGS